MISVMTEETVGCQFPTVTLVDTNADFTVKTEFIVVDSTVFTK